ncbi:MAG TPA: hypothetical protein VMV06_08150 [Acidimicrobiales bacterium]|nr:hypothetical protein [Acidimicrobiales bacterium]
MTASCSSAWTTRPLLATIIELHHVAGEASGPDLTLSIRSGIASGDVILMEGDDYIGHCVNVAARLCDLAGGGEALAAPSVMEDMPRWGTALEHRDIALRGVEKSALTARIGMADLVRSACPIRSAASHCPRRRSRRPPTPSGDVTLFCSPAPAPGWRSRRRGHWR